MCSVRVRKENKTMWLPFLKPSNWLGSESGTSWFPRLELKSVTDCGLLPQVKMSGTGPTAASCYLTWESGASQWTADCMPWSATEVCLYSALFCHFTENVYRSGSWKRPSFGFFMSICGCSQCIFSLFSHLGLSVWMFVYGMKLRAGNEV